MTENQKQLLDDYGYGKISLDQFLPAFGNDIEDIKFIKNEIALAIQTGQAVQIERTISLLWINQNFEQFIHEFNLLLITPNHTSHQAIARTIQELKSPDSIPFIRKALESNFDYLEYTYSESDAIAKWLSWALFSIGTAEAIALMKEFANASDEGIRNEMIYRLKKIT